MAPLTGTQFCLDNYNLPPEASSTGGKMVPFAYQEGMLDVMCAENLGVNQITVLKSARIGYSAVALGVMMYGLGKSRKNMAFYMSTDALAKKFTKDTIDPTFVLCPPVADALDDIKNRKKDDTATYKNLNGKTLRIMGANTSNSFRTFGVDTMILDEVDEYPRVVKGAVAGAKGQGSPIGQAHVRVTSSSRGGLVILGSSPVEKETSTIYEEFMAADVAFKFYMKCPHCGKRDFLEWGRMKATIPYEEEELTLEERINAVGHVCGKCGVIQKNEHLQEMLATGRWQVGEARGDRKEDYTGYYIHTDKKGFNLPTFMTPEGDKRPFPRRIAFEIWQAYHPHYPWTLLSSEWLEAEDDPIRIQNFLQTRIGQPYAEDSEEVSEAELLSRIKPMEALPDEYEAVYAAVDVQRGKGGGDNGWLSMLLTTYAPGERCIIFDRIEFQGDTSVPDQGAWLLLYKFLRRNPSWRTEGGKRVRIHSIIVDSGDQTRTVYKAWSVLAHILGPGRVKVCKGWDTLANGRAIVDDVPTKRKGRPPLYNVGTNQAKRTLMRRFKEDGRIILSKTLPQEVLPELMSEREVVGKKNGRTVRKWEPVPGIDRNEALDCAVYTLALHLVTNFRFSVKTEEKGEKQKPTKKKQEEVTENETEPNNNLGLEYSKETPAPTTRRRRVLSF